MRPLSLAVLLASCVGGGGGSSDAPPGGGDGGLTLTVAGQVVDFETATAVAGAASVLTAGLNAQPSVQVTGASFTITGIPLYSVFFLYSGAPPTHRQTYNVATTVGATDVTGIQAQALSEDYLGRLQAAFGVTPNAGTGIVLVRLTDAAGAPRAGLMADLFYLNGGPQTGYYLDATKQPAATASETSASGYVVFYDVAAPMVTITAATGANYTVEAPVSPVAAGSVTLVDVKVADGMLMLPTNVSFSNDVIGVFERRGCQPCHSGNGIGRDLGNLTLDGGETRIYSEVTEEISPKGGVPRVNLAMPELSLLLTLPGQPADRHPNITFASNSDPDYLLLLVWIREGARQN